LVCLPAMIRALSLVWDPATVWERIVQERKSLGLVFLAYFFPMMILGALGEGITLEHWRTWTAGTHGVMRFNFGQIVVFETIRSVMTCVITGVSAYVIWLLREPFYARYNYREALMLVMYSTCPMLLCQVLTGVPQISLWLSWAVGVYFSLRIFYPGVRGLAKTDPGSATGLYLLSSLLIIALTGAQRYMLIECLSGRGSSINNFIYDFAAKLTS
jgi:Yip1 domain